MGNNIKEIIIKKLKTRIDILKEHRHTPIEPSENQYSELNQAVSKVLNVALCKELEGLRDYIETL